jgi:hypothetical protein
MSAQRSRDMGLWVAIGVTLMIVLSAVLGSSDELELTQTSYGKIGEGYGALYDFLHTLAPEVSRSRAAFAANDPDRTLWLVRPMFLELGKSALMPGWSTERERNMADELRAFLERGGRAVVFGGERADWEAFGIVLGEPSEKAQFFTESQIGPRRRLELQGLRRFLAVEDGEMLLTAGEDGIVASKDIGKGRLIAVSDARLFDNQHFDAGDHSTLALDLARAYGAPVFDERCHGLVDNASLLAAIGRGRLLLLALGFSLWGLTVVYARRRLPTAELPARPEILPGLGAFVDPLALLYTRAAPRNAPAVYRAYAHGLRFRLRRSLFGPRGGSDALLDQRLAHELAKSDADLLAELRGQRAPRNPSEIEAAARRMERYLGTAVHARKQIGGPR